MQKNQSSNIQPVISIIVPVYNVEKIFKKMCVFHYSSDI